MSQNIFLNTFNNCHYQSLAYYKMFPILFVILLSSVNTKEINVWDCDDQLKPPSIINYFNQLVEEPPTYSEYHKLYQKQSMKGTVKYQLHCDTYYANVYTIIEKSKQVTWNMGTNNFTDWTQTEFAAFQDLLTLDEPENNEQSQQQEQILSVGAPSSLDWVEKGKVSSVKNQGSCGSCWSFATSAYGQSRILIRNQTQIDLSQQYLLSCTKDSTCNGGYLEHVFQQAASGVPLQQKYRYTGSILTSPFICFERNKIFFGHYPVKKYRQSDQDIINQLQNEPLAITISSDGWQTYKGGIFSCNVDSKTNHAVLLVGYTPDYWIIKNQWGTNWGQEGYMRITRNPERNCQIGRGVFYMFQTKLGYGLLSILMIIMIMCQF